MSQFPGFSPVGIYNGDDVGMTDADDESTCDEQQNATISRTADQFRNTLKISPTKLSIPNPLRNYFAISAVVDPNFSAPAASSRTSSSSSSAPPAALPMTPVYTPPPPLVTEPEKPGPQLDTPRPKPQARNKVPLEKGYSQMFWLRLIQTETDLAGLKGESPRRLLSMDEVKKHTSEGEAWTVLRGRVYNISPYLKFHPGGPEMLMKAAGKDGTALFNKYHSWVNAEFLMEKCMRFWFQNLKIPWIWVRSSKSMEEALRHVMPWLGPQDVGNLGSTCRAMTEAARSVHGRRTEDASQGWETFVVPIENRVDDCLYPYFHYTPFSQPSWHGHSRFRRAWGGEKERERERVSESEFGGVIMTGTVLHGPGIGCRCPNDCSARNGLCWSTEGSSEGLDNVSRMSKFQEQTRGFVNLQFNDQFRDEDNIYEIQHTFQAGSVKKQRRLCVQDSSCGCGRFWGGHLAYDSNSRLCLSAKQLAIQGNPALAGQVNVESPQSAMVEKGINSIQLSRDNEIDNSTFLEPLLLMECGQVCACSRTCKYRTSQNGVAVRVKVVRTTFKGWGLVALQAVKHGSFVCEYAGELITIHEARQRQKVYDNEHHLQGSALLTLREHLPSGNASVRVNVDATKVGNVARFINHSCDGGNLIPCLIRVAGCIIPKLALFARRNILDGDELTYSYGKADQDSETLRACLCGTTACVGKLPSEQT